MRVLFDHQVFSYQAYGGVSRYFCELMAAFERAGEPNFTLGVTESPNEYLARAPFYRGASVTKSGIASFLRTYARNELATLAASRRGQHDILHATFYAPGVLRSVRGAKLVVTLHDMIPERFPEHYEASSLYTRAITRRWVRGKRMLCERADAIIAVSEHTKRDAVAMYGIAAERITVIHHGTSVRAGGDRPQPSPSGLPGHYLLYVGTRNTYKNWHVLVAAIAPLLEADRQLGVLCVGGGAFTPSERELLRRYRASDRVIQRSVADEELPACYAHAVALVFPSRYEGFGMPILEAFACGCPVLVADASCFPEVAADAALYCTADDADSLRAQLQRLLGDETLRAELRAKGLARVQQFTWEATAQRTAAVYRGIMRTATKAAS